MRWLIVALLILHPWTRPFWIGQAHAQDRVALVIGVSTYQSVASLPNAGNDAGIIAKSLQDAGFAVTQITKADQLDRAHLSVALLRFRSAAAGAEAAIIYYAGHGVEVGGKNWLLPADVKADNPDELEVTALPASAFVNAVSAAGKVRLVILDACRDNPFAGLPGWARAGRSVASDRGLSRERDLPPNVVVLLATQAGARASDGVGTLNSPFAMALAGALEQDGLQLAALPSVISNGMKQASGLDQRPDQQGIFDSPFWTFRQSRDVSQTAIGQSFVRAPAEGDDEQVAMQVHDCDQATVDAGILRGGEGMITISATRRGDPQTRERKAISVCKKALAQAPGNGRLMNNIARLYGRINDDKQARYWYDEGVRVNDAETMTSVGKFLMDGTDGYTRDSVLGITMLERAARQGSALAMIALGDIYHDGKGTRQDPAEAFRWYELGAALSDSWAMFRTGEMALIGLGHSLDYALATKWLEKAQLASDWWTSATSMYYLGQIHELGLGVPKDLAQARHLYEQAIARGDLADAKARLAKLPQ